MAWRDWFNRKTLLELAIERGLRDGGSVANEVARLHGYAVQSREDAEAICGALRTVLARETRQSAESAISSDLHALTGLFRKVGGAECDAFPVLAKDGTALLIEAVDVGLASPGRFKEHDLLNALEVLAIGGTAAGTDAVIRAARHPLKPDGYLWSHVLSCYSADHPERERLFEALMGRWPSDYFARMLLEAATQLRLGGSEFCHPFDTAEGKRQLERWLTNSEEEEYGAAVSAAAALAFMSGDDRNQLLAIAMGHVHPSVQMEAAWAAAKLGGEGGIKVLARYCLDVNRSDQAKRYLTELERADAIPAEASSPDFAAKAEFAQWLAHANELGRAPDELEIIDHRVLAWPLESESIPLWLVKYRVRAKSALEEDDEGVGMVGKTTACLFSYKLNQRPPEDGYAIHCCWELQHGLISASDLDEPHDEYDQMLSQWKGKHLIEPRILQVVELSPQLGYPQRLVALASAQHDGEPGWVVLDGPRSAWYPAAEMPESHPSTVWQVHVGRRLLGFQDQPDRRRFLKSPLPEPAPQAAIDAYERLLTEATTAPAKRQAHLLSRGTIRQHWDKYVTAVQTLSGDSRAACVARCYEKLLHVATRAPESIHHDVLDSHGAAGTHFSAYVDALVELGRQAEVTPLVEVFRPHWQHNMGYGDLGTAAFKAGDYDTAEDFFITLAASLEHYWRHEEMALLAEIWHRRGETAEAQDLLAECLRRLIAESETGEKSGRNTYELWFQRQRKEFLRVFAPDGEAELKRLGIRESTL